MSRLIAFWSPARSGATTLLTNTAAAVAASGLRVAALDLNLITPSLALHFDLLPPVRPLDLCLSRLFPLLQGERLTAADLERHLVSPPDLRSLRVLPGLLNPALASRLTENGVRSICGAAAGHDLILCDLPPPLDSVATFPVLEAASLIILVCSPEYPARFHTKRYLIALSDLGWLDRTVLVLNRSGSVSESQVAAELGLPIAMSIPALPEMEALAEQGAPAVKRRGLSRPLARFRSAVGRLAHLVRGG